MREGDAAEIAGYRIESELARGGMGVVYLARQVFPDRRVALKLLSPELAADPDFRDRFVRESNAAASTEHPNIVPIYGAGEAEGRLFLAMRYVEGTDLGTTIRREGRLDPQRAVSICTQIAAALDAAHARGLVHRDVKPGNVLIDPTGHAYLTDFGLITRNEVETGITKTGQFMGSTAYCAPEQIKGEAVDARTDVYSLGCLLYECLTGEPPFPRPSEAATLYAHLEEPPPRPSAEAAEVPSELDALVAKAMAKHPEDRFPSAGELAVAARAVLSPAYPAPSARGPARGWLIAAGAAILGLVIATVAFALRDGGTAKAPARSQGPEVILRSGLLAFDPTMHEVSARVPIPYPTVGGFPPPPAVAGEGGIWTVVNGDLWRVDPSTGGARQIQVPRCHVAGAKASELGITAIDVGPGAVWALCHLNPVLLVRIDPFTDQAKAIPTGVRQTGGPIPAGAQIATSPTEVWVALGDGTIRRFDAARGRNLGPIGIRGDDLAVGEGKLWVVDELSSTLTPVNARTGEPGTPILVTGNIDDVAVGEGAAWVLDRSGGTVTPIDAATEAVEAPIGVGPGGTSIAVGFGAVWVTEPGDRSLIRIDPLTGQTETFDVSASAVGTVADAQSSELWIVVAQTARV